MNTIVEAIGISVLSSLATVFLLATCKAIWKQWGEDVLLKFCWRHVVDLNGEWIAKPDYEGMQVTELMKLKQAGWRLSGTIDYTATEGDRQTNRQLVVEGIFRGDVVSILYWNSDKTCVSSGSMSLRLVNDGQTLRGFTALYEKTASDIDHDDISYERVRPMSLVNVVSTTTNSAIDSASDNDNRSE